MLAQSNYIKGWALRKLDTNNVIAFSNSREQLIILSGVASIKNFICASTLGEG